MSNVDQTHRLWCMLFFHVLLIIDMSSSAEYYVNNKHSLADDSNSGLKESPWRTIQRAADILEAGDVCYVKEGSYQERIRPIHSGNCGNLITFIAAKNVKILGFQLSEKQYIRAIGFEMTHDGTLAQHEAITLSGSNGCEILDNYIHHTYSLAIWMRQEIPTNNVLISGNKLAFIGSVCGHQVGDVAIKIWGDNNIVEYNDISHVADFINMNGSGNIVRNNY